MQQDLRLSGHLSRALSHEMAVVQQYLLQAKLVDMWGMAAQSAKFRTDVSEELTHAERLMERMLILGIPCNGKLLLRDGLGIRSAHIECVTACDSTVRVGARLIHIPTCVSEQTRAIVLDMFKLFQFTSLFIRTHRDVNAHHVFEFRRS